MAAIKKTQKLIVLVRTSTGPDVYEAPCSFNTSREFTIEANVVETPSIDCDDPDAPAWIARAVDSFSAGISGAGTLDTEDLAFWRAWALDGSSKMCRVKIDETGADGGGHFQGEFLLTSMGLAKEGRGYATFSAELQSNGAITWTAAS